MIRADTYIPAAENGNVTIFEARLNTSIRCDRILWKSTVPVELESDDEEEPLDVYHRIGFGPRMLQFLTQAFKPLSTRTRALSLSSANVPNPVEPAPSRQWNLPPRAITISPDNQLQGVPAPRLDQAIALTKRRSLTSLPNAFSKKTRPPKFGKSKSIEPTTSTPILNSNFRKRGRTQSVQISVPIVDSPVAELGEAKPYESEQPSPLRQEASQHDNSRQHMTSGKSWRLLPFLDREGEPGLDPAARETDAEPLRKTTSPKPSRRPRKGEVVVLGYR